MRPKTFFLAGFSPRRLPVLLILSLSVACAENRLHTYMVLENPAVRGGKTPAKKGEIRLMPAPLKLSMHAPEADDLENLADDLKLATPSKYHRLPALTLLRFDFENRTAIPWRIELAKSYFAEPSGKKYPVLPAQTYASRFTSVAYEHFQYASMYAVYITRRDQAVPAEGFWFDRRKPEEGVTLAYGEAGFQILPFEFIPAGVEDLTFFFPIEGDKMKQIKIRLATERGS